MPTEYRYECGCGGVVRLRAYGESQPPTVWCPDCDELMPRPDNTTETGGVTDE